ncbi:transmembrane protein 107 isoform X1 [Pipistrellus kuhlii]|uniref:Transmembrane protein 107 n=1 Tax=Pipistrellus kuhlii TaxID=59472 RepID=A0A7J7TY59_PIPKU|nr:transmembrane protein 107 isoform X1 [Pipistrellus kuhlii]XP_045442504.1 transmembrane protein 107 isoform X1 [Pipistrellus kuhlii]KAF6305538.1 transmembrane protein 107 [Pipistrellus kuhlii]
MGRISGLVPSRFLTLLAHLVVVITLFWSRDSNIQACLPLTFTTEEYKTQDIQLVAALAVTLGLFAVELAGFFSGVSMFNSTQSLLSIGAHCSASVALSFFIFERWECTTYWYIFVFCRLTKQQESSQSGVNPRGLRDQERRQQQTKVFNKVLEAGQELKCSDRLSRAEGVRRA